MTNPFRVLVVDDESPAREKVVRFLGRDPRFVVAGEARDGSEALQRVETLSPDLLILDIQMPGMSGFEVLENLHSPGIQVVFATAFDTFALQAFEANAVDYLLKPFDEGRFRKALDRAWAFLQAGKETAPPLKALVASLARRPLERLVVKDEDRWIPIPLRVIKRLRADGKQVKVFTEQGEFALRTSLQELESRLDPRRFVRVHRSDIVALDAVDHLEPWDHGDGLLVLKGGGHVVISRTYRKKFMESWGLEG